jgi:predicted nucleic acid-binding protein
LRRYVLDTAIVVGLLRRRLWAVTLCTPWLRDDETATSGLVYAEASEYLRGFPNFEAHRRALRLLLRDVHPYVLTYETLDRYGEIRRSLRPLNQMIGDVDTLIAATALERNLTVVTVDQDYYRVPGLSVRLLTRADLG